MVSSASSFGASRRSGPSPSCSDTCSFPRLEIRTLKPFGDLAEVNSSRTSIEVPQLDDREPSDASSLCFEYQEETLENGSEDPNTKADEGSADHSY